MACSLSNKCAKNLCKWAVLVQLIIKNVVTFFWNTVHGVVSSDSTQNLLRSQNHNTTGKLHIFYSRNVQDIDT